MNFSELESLMSSRGVTALADIARSLNTTPQAVSNWKARNQVPHHIVIKLNQSSPPLAGIPQSSAESPTYSSPIIFEEDTISLSDILIIMAEQLKVIVLVPFITVFLTFTYVQFIQQPQYVSWATILLPENKTANLGGLAGLASQFGVSVPNVSRTDLSSPSLLPDLIHSRTFAEKIVDKKFYTNKFGKELSLLAILTHGNEPPEFGRDTLITEALISLGGILQFDKGRNSEFSTIAITTFEPVFSKELAASTIEELEKLNRDYKSQAVSEKINFIANRISSVKDDLDSSEKRLKEFNERNRQVSTPSLQLELDRLVRDVEIQVGIYLTLKQQLELSKIEEVQQTSVMQILDRPQIAMFPSNINLPLSLLFASFFGILLAIMLAFIKSYLNNNDIGERKKLRKVKYYLRKKIKDIFLDKRFSGIISLLLLLGAPFYLGHKSKIPVFFGRYSTTLMFVNTIYILILVGSLILFIHLLKIKNKNAPIKK